MKKEIAKLIDDIVENKKYSNIQLNYLFKNNVYNNKEKSFINNLVNVTLKNLIYIDYVIQSLSSKAPKRYIKQILRISIAQILYTSSDVKGVIFEAVELAKEYNEYQAKFVNSILRNFELEKENIYNKASENIKLSYPNWFVDKIKIDFGNNYLDVLKRYKNKSYLSVRVNFKILSEKRFLEILEEINTKILFRVEDVFYLNNSNIFKTKDFLIGNIHIQDASSFLVVKSLDVNNGDKVLDVAAAPGGKSIAILEKFKPEILVATDIHEHKIKILKEIEKKYTNFKAILSDARTFKYDKFDKILLDLPCSGLGVLTKKPEKIYNMKLSDIKEIKKLQKKIFDNAYTLLKSGGSMVYSTCTILKNENTNNIEYFLNKYPDLEVENISFPKNVDVIVDEFGGNLISYKNEYLDGFYIIKLNKK